MGKVALVSRSRFSEGSDPFKMLAMRPVPTLSLNMVKKQALDIEYREAQPDLR